MIYAQEDVYSRTATPRLYTSRVTKKAAERGIDLYGMDDSKIFGPVFHNLSFSEAIKKDILTNYQVVIIGVDEPLIKKMIEQQQLVSINSGSKFDSRSLAAKVGLIKAIKDYDLKRVISFHNRVDNAKYFSESLSDILSIIIKDQKPNGKIWTDHVSGKMSAGDRKIKINQLRELEAVDRGILTNARCLSEGVDVRSLDGITFIDPKSSKIDIIQAVGRAIRKSLIKVKELSFFLSLLRMVIMK